MKLFSTYPKSDDKSIPDRNILIKIHLIFKIYQPSYLETPL